MKKTRHKKSDSAFWAEFLPGIEKTITDACVALEVRERELAAEPAPAISDLRQPLQEIGERIANVETVAGRAKETLEEIDALLQKGELELREYIGWVGGLERRLADWEGGA